MGLYSGGLIIGRIFAVCDLGGLFSGGFIFGRAYNRNFTVFMTKMINNFRMTLTLYSNGAITGSFDFTLKNARGGKEIIACAVISMSL